MEWKTGYIVMIPKKGILATAGIGEVSNFYHFQARSTLILDRIRKAVGTGFREDESCTDQVATLGIIIEQLLVTSYCSSDLLTFKKAFDMVERKMIWRILRHSPEDRKYHSELL